MVGRVIGRGGETVKGLQAHTGARIQIDQSSVPCAVTVTGNPFCVEHARRAVEDVIGGGSTAPYSAANQRESARRMSAQWHAHAAAMRLTFEARNLHIGGEGQGAGGGEGAGGPGGIPSRGGAQGRGGAHHLNHLNHLNHAAMMNHHVNRHGHHLGHHAVMHPAEVSAAQWNAAQRQWSAAANYSAAAGVSYGGPYEYHGGGANAGNVEYGGFNHHPGGARSGDAPNPAPAFADAANAPYCLLYTSPSPRDRG